MVSLGPLNGFSQKPAVLGVLGAVILVALAFLSGPQYATNDDVGLLWALNGGDGFPSHPFALFNGFFLNGILYRLYAAAPGVPWWGLLVYAASATGAGLILSALFRSGRVAWVVLPAAAWFLWLCLARTGITSATLLLSVGALLGLGARVQAPASFPDGREEKKSERTTVAESRSRVAWTGLAFCLTASLLMRWQIAAAFLIFALLLVAMSSGITRRRMAMTLFVALAVLAADRLASAVFTTPDARVYLRDNALRARFHDTPEGLHHGAVTARALDSAGWTADDYAFFRAWNIQDDSLFNARSLEVFLTENAIGTDGLQSLAARLAEGVGNARKNLVILVLALLALAFRVTERRRHREESSRIRSWRKLIPWLLPLSCCGAILYFAQFRFVERVYLPLFLLTLVAVALAFTVTSPHPPEDSPGQPWARRILTPHFILALVLMIVQSGAVLYFSYGQWRKLGNDVSEARFVAACLERRVDETGDAPMAYLDPASGLGIENIHPLRETFNKSRTPVIVPGGFWIGSPRWRLSLQVLGPGSGRGFLRQSVGTELDWVLLNEGATARPVLEAWEGYYRRNLDIAMRLFPASVCRDARGRELTFYRMLAPG